MPWKSPTTMASTVTVVLTRFEVTPLPWMTEISVGPVSLSAIVMLAEALAPRS